MQVPTTDNSSCVHAYSQSGITNTAKGKSAIEGIVPETRLVATAVDTVTISKESIAALNSEMEALRLGTELPVQYYELLSVELVTPLEMLVERPEENPNTSLQSNNTSTQVSSSATEETSTTATPAKNAVTTSVIANAEDNPIALVIRTMNIYNQLQ